MEIRKITTGFVVQRWDGETKKFLGQDFTAGDDAQYENEAGHAIDETEPKSIGGTSLCQLHLATRRVTCKR